jgi:hypothetical protein
MYGFDKIRLSVYGIAVGLAFLSALPVSYFAWMYRANSNFRNDVKILWFRLSAWDKDRTILLLGDSRIAAMSCARDFTGWRILNLGVSGSEARDWASFVTTRAKTWHFNVIVLWVGINDIANAGRAAGNVAPDILNILRKVDASSNRIVLINSEDVPFGPNTMVPDGIRHKLSELSNILKSSATKYEILTPFASVQDKSHGELYVDYMHLNEGGYRVLCAELAQRFAGYE